MATNKRRQNRENIDKIRAELAAQGVDLIPDDELARFRALMAQPHRTEDDWTVVKTILTSHRLLTAKPQHPAKGFSDVDGVLLEDDKLMAFTNLDDLMDHLHEGQKRRPPEASQVFIGSIDLNDLLILSDEEEKTLYIDYQSKHGRRFISYFNKSLSAREITKEDYEQSREIRKMLANLRLAVEELKMERFSEDDEDYEDGD